MAQRHARAVYAMELSDGQALSMTRLSPPRRRNGPGRVTPVGGQGVCGSPATLRQPADGFGKSLH